LRKLKNVHSIVLFKNSVTFSQFDNDSMHHLVEMMEIFLEKNIHWEVVKEIFHPDEPLPHLFVYKASNNTSFDILQRIQFPSDCKRQRYFIAPIWKAGFGSFIFVNSIALASSVTYNR
jgi:hypothetical protein